MPVETMPPMICGVVRFLGGTLIPRPGGVWERLKGAACGKKRVEDASKHEQVMVIAQLYTCAHARECG